LVMMHTQISLIYHLEDFGSRPARAEKVPEIPSQWKKICVLWHVPVNPGMRQSVCGARLYLLGAE
jgi:hypothetical protein